jgi:hypothetical protein
MVCILHKLQGGFDFWVSTLIICMHEYTRTSTADATRKIVASAHGRPIICKPIGSPSLS